jgi:signal transduction histidine kinase
MNKQSEEVVDINRTISGFAHTRTTEDACAFLTRSLAKDLKIPRIIMGLRGKGDVFNVSRFEGFPPSVSGDECNQCLQCEAAIQLVMQTGRRVMKGDFAGNDFVCTGMFSGCSFWPMKGKTGILSILVMDDPGTEKGDMVTILLNQASPLFENVLLYQNLTEMNNELVEANRMLRDNDSRKSDFLNLVAHDLRTPLTSIRSYADLLLMYKDEPGEVRVEFITTIIKESIRVSNLINDYLDLSLIESGTMTYNMKPVDISELINGTLKLFRDEADRKGIELTCVIEHGLPEVMADQNRLGQVLDNLLANAVKFTPDGGAVSVQALLISDCIESQKTDPNYLEISVTDTGNGIDPKDHQRIFLKFGQLEDRGDGKAKGGTGLGLAITKEIVEKHGGTIRVESEFGKGARFVVTLPCHAGGYL